MSLLRFFTTEKIGSKMSKTPEGFLLCEGVPLARTGEMQYGPGETPIPTGPQGWVTITRDAGEVFRPEFIASLNGKPAVNEHPEDDVNPLNWNVLSVGTVMNPRRGEGAQDDLLIGDILICNADAIADVLSGKREVSVGYEAEYDETGPGQGRQYNLIANHVALVDAGRCGPRCSISDRKTVKSKTGDCSMKTKDKKLSWIDRIMKAVKTKDEAAIEEAVTEVATDAEEMAAEGEAIHIHAPAQDTMAYDELNSRVGNLESGMGQIHDMMSQIGSKLGITFGAQDADETTEEKEKREKEEAETRDRAKASDSANAELLENLEAEAPTDAPKDKVRKARDSEYLGTSHQETVSGAEILTPGAKGPEFDQKAEPAKTLDSICQFRRTTLDAAYKTTDGKEILDGILQGKPLNLAGMKCREVRDMFRNAVKVKKERNNAAAAVKDIGPGDALAGIQVGAVTSVADLNEKHRKHYGLSQ